MARITCVLLLALLPAQRLLAQSPPDADTFDRTFSRALEMQKAGDYVGAIETYKAALTIDPKRVDALSNLGAAYVHLGQFEDAIAYYKTALEIDAGNATVRMNLALAYYKSARPNEAVEPLKAVVAAAPETKNAYLILADCYLQTGRPQEAVALLKPRDAMFDGDLAFAYVLGTALLQTNDEKQGQVYIDQIFKAGDSAEAHLLMGVAYLNQFAYAAAKSELERALQLNPRLSTANSAHGRALLGLGDQPAAERAFRQELSVNINDFESNLMLGSMRRADQDFVDALIYLNRALAIHPGDLSARKLIASVKLQTGAVEDAAKMLEAIVKDSPDSVDAHVQLATAYNRLKRREDAAREREIVNRLNRENQAKQSPKNEPATPPSGTPRKGPAGGSQEGSSR
jgi:tetratricopeptide (TPR) repeat protein